MIDNQKYLPEYYSKTSYNVYTLNELKEALLNKTIIKALAVACDSEYNLKVDLGICQGDIPRKEVSIIHEPDGFPKPTLSIFKVGLVVLCKIIHIGPPDDNGPKIILSIAEVEKEVRSWVFGLNEGDVIPGIVRNMEQYGAFIDIGAGVTGLLHIEDISINRIEHSNQRFQIGQRIPVVIKRLDAENGRIILSHKELLGNWEENVAFFQANTSVLGIVRNIVTKNQRKDANNQDEDNNGFYIELRPNLTGLADPKKGIKIGQRVNVYIRSINPQNRKIRLNIVGMGIDYSIESNPRYQEEYMRLVIHADKNNVQLWPTKKINHYDHPEVQDETPPAGQNPDNTEYRLELENTLSTSRYGEKEELPKLYSDKVEFGEKEDLSKTYSGIVKLYKPQFKYGFIASDQLGGIVTRDLFFHLNQINDDELRKLLIMGKAVGTKVEFSLGRNINNSIAGDNIRSSEPLANYKEDELYSTGEIAEYNRLLNYGKVQCQDGFYTFNDSNIIDPYLKAYLNYSLKTIGWKVKFLFRTQPNGKRQIDCLSSLEPFLEEDIADWIRSKILTTDSLLKWERIRNEDVKEHTTGSEISLGEYVPLMPLEQDALRTSAVPLPEHSTQSPKKELNVLALYNEAARICLKKSATEEELTAAAEKYSTALTHESILLKNDKLESSVLSLVSVLMRLNRLEEAIALIDRYTDDNRISKEKLLNLHIQVLERSKSNTDLLISLYDQAINLTQKQNTRMHYMLRIAYLYQCQAKYNEAIDRYNQWERSSHSSRLTGNIPSVAEQYVRHNLAICYYGLGQINKAKALASELIKLNPDNTVADSILKDTIDLGAHQQSIEENIYSLDTTELTGIGNLNEYLLWLINKTDITAFLKRSAVRDGRYIGSPEQAIDDVEYLTKSTRGDSPKARSGKLLGAAKIILQMIDSNQSLSDDEQNPERNILTLKHATTYSARGIASFGDNMVENRDAQHDTVRSAYHQALYILSNHEQDWNNSFTRCLSTYFLDRQEMQQIVRTQMSTNPTLTANTDILDRDPLSLQEFTVGLIMLLKCIKHVKWYKRLQEDVYRSRHLAGILEELAKMKVLDSVISKCTLNQFKNYCTKAMDLMDNAYHEIENALDNCMKNAFLDLGSDEALQRLDDNNLLYWLSGTDKHRLQDIYKVFQTVKQYQLSKDFEKRANALAEIQRKINNLCVQIEEFPTHFSYAYYLQRLYRLSEQISDIQADLYKKFPPLLSVMQTDHEVYKSDDGKTIRIHLAISNEKNHQMADNISIQIKEPPGVYLHDTSGEHIRGVRGGTTEEAILTLELPLRMLQERVCDITISVKYKFSNYLAETIEREITEVLTLNLYERNEFTHIENPYAGRTRAVMKDPHMFYGRDAQINKLVSQIQATDGTFNKGHAVALYGQTRAGKSSLLYHSKKRIREVYWENAIIVDIGSVGELYLAP